LGEEVYWSFRTPTATEEKKNKGEPEAGGKAYWGKKLFVS